MKKIAIISSSVRDGRLSHRAALFLDNLLRSGGLAESDVIDLKQYDFPLFHERLMYQKEPSEAVLDFARRITEADGVVLITPVYNGSFAPALKNVIDLLYKEWHHKPVAVYSATYTHTPGIASVQQVQTLMLKLGAWVAPVLGTFINIATELAEDGTPANPDTLVPVMRPPLDDLLWLIDRK